jgi:DNA-binding NarL/FixJ family response regulator/putative methionine-R-sulfoxide reductase with GAF domain
MAVVSAVPDGPTAIFTHRIDKPLDWLAVLGADVFERAERGPFVTPVAAGRWIEGAGYAVIAPLVSWNGQSVLCGLRQDVPFDAVDAGSAEAGARMLEMSALEGRALAETLRQSAGLEERLQVLSGIGDELAHARDTSALLARAAQEVARRMGAGAASIMVVEGDELKLRASVGLPTGAVGSQQRVGHGIAGWVAASGEKVVLHGRVEDTRFRGTDPDAGESVSVPLREGDDVLGVLSVKRPDTADGFTDRHELLDAVALDLGRALRAMGSIAELERERASAHEEARVARAVAARDVSGALRAALALGHHAVAVRDATGRVIGTEALEGDDACRESALAASERVRSWPGRTSVGFARHGAEYREEEGELSQRTADTLALLGHEFATEVATALRVLAVEDHPVMRLGVRAMLEREGFVVAGTTATCGEALGLLSEARADVVLLDLRLPDATGAEAVVRIREAAPTLPIVVFSVERTPALIRAVVRAGANGYVTKDAPTARLVAALRAAAAGLVALGPDEAIAAASASPAERTSGDERTVQATLTEPTNGGSETPHEPLTPRELELLRYMAEGYTNKEVARAMVLAEDTVKKAVQTLIAKLGAADRTNAVVLALRNHLID